MKFFLTYSDVSHHNFELTAAIGLLGVDISPGTGSAVNENRFSAPLTKP
jgi:hypothetical protein